jgi:hypothetical protein
VSLSARSPPFYAPITTGILISLVLSLLLWLMSR